VFEADAVPGVDGWWVGLVGLIVVIAVVVGRPNGSDRPVAVSKYIISIDLPPLVTLGRASQVVGAVVQLFSAIPVFLLDAGTLLPLVVVTIGAVVVVVLILMVLCERGHARKCRCQERECKRSGDAIHIDSSVL
jgi:hypothetical protein